MLRWYRKQKKKREYQFGKPIGYGTYAEVREAIKKSTGEKVAIKIISKKLLSTTDKPLIEREIASLNSVRHPNIIVLRDWFESGKKVYLVFELAGGGELFDRIYTLKQFSERDAARLIKSITSAVKVLHDHGIIHRDLKPENILFKSQDPKSDIVIADFGVATFADDDELFYTICGSPGYAAPEILLGRGHHKAVDVWSIGVITYTLLSGYAPFTPTDDLSKMVSNMLNNRLTFHHKYWSHISDTAKDFISQLLNPDPSLRPSCAEILQHPWL
ncbi:kinase-like domain-containing protein, partial [Paraphysoderma sedebokerense]